MPTRMVMTVTHNRNIGIEKKEGRDNNQLFYFDHLSRTIKSRGVTAKSISIQARGSRRGSRVEMSRTDARWW
jgi:hypothetical protein